MIGPCAKLQVSCTIVSDAGRWTGDNSCSNAQQVCPRSPGEGYEKCKTICEQPSHAEVSAIRLAGENARGAVAYIEGHTYACDNCKVACAEAGIVEIVIGPPPV